MKQPLQKRVICLLLFFGVGAMPLLAGTNVLVIGSSKSFSENEYPRIPRTQKAFNPKLVVDQLKKILGGDSSLGPVNVTFEDVYRTSVRTFWNRPHTAKCYSLLGYYYHPDKREDRLKNLQGKGGTKWDYVIIMGDPSIIANTPGVYARGVKLILDTIKEGDAKPLLMMQWPHSGSTVSVDDVGEVTYRVGDSGGIPVAPAGYAWNDLATKDKGAHPTPKGAYLAAATIYSKIFNRSASESKHTHGDGSLAKLAHATVKKHVNKTHYTGLYDTVHPHLILGVKDRVIQGLTNGSSTEQSFLSFGGYNKNKYFNALLATEIHVSIPKPYPNWKMKQHHFHLGRGWIEGAKQYRPDPAVPHPWFYTEDRIAKKRLPGEKKRVYRYSFGYSYNIRSVRRGQTLDSSIRNGGLDSLYGIDAIPTFARGDQNLAFKMIKGKEVSKGVRVLPVYSLWAAVNDKMGLKDPYKDGRHYGADVCEAVVSYMMTLLTGRCPIGKNGTAEERQRQTIGYEAAWTMSTLNLRPPGYTVFPSATDATVLKPGGKEALSVYFINRPKSTVTVTVSVDNPSAVKVSPKTLTFNARNHDTIQKVTLTALDGKKTSEEVNVSFKTTSKDMCFNGLTESWTYTVDRAASTKTP